ncbi:MAG: hypothetical protein J6J30_00875 [Clostridia bacterium]|nr:hypothetical protein [Clostridia bacterium]
MSYSHCITENYIKYYPEKLNFSKDFDSCQGLKGFVCKVRLKSKPSNLEKRIILKIDGFLEISIKLLSKEKNNFEFNSYDSSEQYFVYADEKGNSPIITAEIYLQNEYFTERKSMRIGLPLNLYDAVNNDIYLFYDGVRFSWIYNGKIVNSNFPFGNTKAGELWYDDSALEMVGFCCDLSRLKTSKETEKTERSIAYYSFAGYNDWAGDVVNFWHNGVYHLLILYDRHHHGNRFGGGAHTTMHLTTSDFISWENHGEIYSLNYPWETFGTGTMFYHKGKYYYSFGLHTSRMMPDEKTAGHLILNAYEETGETTPIRHSEICEKGFYPNGANYLVSEDGINFVPSYKQVHWSENPSIYTNSDETLTMYAGYGADGTWQAPDIDGPWRRVDSNFPTDEMRKISGCSTECPSMFEWNGYKYLLMGITGFFQTEKNSDILIDMTAKNMDFYDGLCVPMVANCCGRYILSGWLAGWGFAYVIAHRELIQKDNGMLGIKWMPEYTPDTKNLALRYEKNDIIDYAKFNVESKHSYYIEFAVAPSECGRVGIGFDGDGKSFVLSLNTKTAKVQTSYSENSNSFPEEMLSIGEYIIQHGAIGNFRNLTGDIWHKDGVNFAISNVEEIRREYVFKMILHYEPKKDSLILDAEIGGGRTLISNRKNFKAQKLTLFTENATIKKLRIYDM